MRIARQSIFVGLGLSLAAMGVASIGALPPLYGAIFQEVLDVAVILNALRSRSRQPIRDIFAKLAHRAPAPPTPAPLRT
jgi:cation transport ATPase